MVEGPLGGFPVRVEAQVQSVRLPVAGEAGHREKGRGRVDGAETALATATITTTSTTTITTTSHDNGEYPHVVCAVSCRVCGGPGERLVCDIELL